MRASFTIEGTTDSGSTEVFNTYGDLSNVALLARYGFAIEANSKDRITWSDTHAVCADAGQRPDVQDEEIWRELVEQWLGDRNATATTELFIDADAQMSIALWLYLAVLASREAGVLPSLAHLQAAWDAQELFLMGEVDCVVGEELVTTLRNLANLACGLLQKRLAGMHQIATPIDELFDHQDSLLQADAERPIMLALNQNISERLCLTACLAYWKELLEVRFS